MATVGDLKALLEGKADSDNVHVALIDPQFNIQIVPVETTAPVENGDTAETVEPTDEQPS